LMEESSMISPLMGTSFLTMTMAMRMRMAKMTMRNIQPDPVVPQIRMNEGQMLFL
jgi:hypothetical protein